MSQDDFTSVDEPTGRDEPGSQAASVDLLKGEAQAVGSRLIADWNGSTRELKPLLEQWKVNRARTLGYSGVKLIKVQNESRAYFPNGSSPSDHMSKAGRLRRRTRAVLFADPPKPEALPSTGEDADVESAEFATRVLEDLCSEGKLDYGLAAGDAFDLGSDYASGFIRFWVDPKGGGWQPRQIMAHPQAQTEADAMTDPATGLEADADVLRPRYVTEDGTLTDDRTTEGIQRMWLPAIEREPLTGKHVRFLPSTCEDIWSATGLMIGAMVPLSEVTRQFPDLAKLPKDELEKLAESKPPGADDLLPAAKRGFKALNPGERPVFVLTRYELPCPDYQMGAYVIAVGAEGKVVHRQHWYDERNNEVLDLPVTQFKQFVDEDNPYGRGMMETLGLGDEHLAQIKASMAQHLERFGHRKQYLPLHSNLTAEQLQSPTYTVLSIVPNGEPRFEEIPDFPQMAEKMYERLSAEMDDESGLQQVAQGVNTPSVKSGTHAQTIVEQVNQGLSDLREHTERGLVRGWRIVLQLVRAYYTVPQRIQWVGEDGAYKAQTWTASDLGSTRDVRLARGSFTQLAPSAKAELAGIHLESGAIGPEEYAEALASQTGGLVGLRDNPHRLRVRGQVARWREGPPDGWTPPQPGGPGPLTGEPMENPPDPTIMAIFDHRDVDDDPTVARLRAFELGRALASDRFQQFPPPWADGLRQAYVAARQAAGIQTVAEQQAAAQAQAEAQQQAQGQQMQAQQAAKGEQDAGAMKKMAMEQQMGERKMAMEGDKMAMERERMMMESARADQESAARSEAALTQAQAAAAALQPPPLLAGMVMERDPENGGRWIVVPQYAESPQ